MIKTTIHIAGMLLILGFSEPAAAQFINLQLKIEPELSATVEQELDFGTQITNSGRKEISIGDVNMGVFSIRAYYTQNVYLSLRFPDALRHSNPAIREIIPLELSLAYNNSGTNRPSESIPLTANNGLVSVHEKTELESRNDIWKELFLYIYGYIDVGNIPNGEYTGDIVLSIDYD